MSDAVVIQAAVSGSIAGADASPHLPLTPEQIADEAVAAWRAGAAAIHIHAREHDGTPTQSRERYAEIVEAVQASGCDAILNLSTGSAGGRAQGMDRAAPLELAPEMASFDCGSLNFGDRVFENSPPFLRDLAAAFKESGAAPEIECFDTSHVVAALRLREQGLLSDPLRFQFVLGVRGGAPATLEQAMYMRSLIPADAIWSICALGRMQLALNTFCLIAGGHVRTGLEDNLYYRKGEYANGNAQLVERVVLLAETLGRPVADSAQARELLQLAGAGAQRSSGPSDAM
jgi:3-keto-5-aminohexanoate cleavage enzyme